MITIAIADDEPLVRRGLRSHLENEPDIRVVGEARNGTEALALIRSTTPDLVFLDIQMPGLDGLGVLAALPAERRPAIVFVTAHDAYAVRAFDLHAVDYLLKPFDGERFRTALARARERLRMRQTEATDLELLATEMEEGRARPDRIAVREQGKIVLVPLDEIEWIEAADNYVRLHRAGNYHLLRQSLGRLDEMLDPKKFARIHRSAMVNLSRVKALEPTPSGEYEVILHDGRRLTLSRSHRDRFMERFQL
ncbi:MAG TPA: LytTR family DNA-binding domain-containing protein [Gemmatimonadales bacterium]|nr:LytTR family DNA-binding domain-containing protein [Gemmatimonadales bacterium]